MGLSPLVLLALGAGAQGFTKRRRRGQPEWLLWDSSVPKGCAVPRFCRLYNTFKVSLPPGVECLELRDGAAAWQLCPFFTLFSWLLNMCLESRGLHQGSGKVPLHRVVFHWRRGQHRTQT